MFYHWKVSPIMLAHGEAGTRPMLVRCTAYTSLTMWFGVLLAGRLIPYVGTG